MQIPGANIASSVVGAAEAKSRDAAAKLRANRHKPAPKVDRPYGDEAVAQTELSQAARRAAGNEQEDAREDHEENAGYGPLAAKNQPPRAHLDLEG